MIEDTEKQQDQVIADAATTPAPQPEVVGSATPDKKSAAVTGRPPKPWLDAIKAETKQIIEAIEKMEDKVEKFETDVETKVKDAVKKVTTKKANKQQQEKL